MNPPQRALLLNYPTYIKRQLDYFENLKLQPTLDGYDILKGEYRSKIGAVPTLSLYLKKGVELYRARLIKKQSLNSIYGITENDFFDNIRELGINSAARTTEFGRANRIGEPVFYTGLKSITAIHEIAQWDRIQRNIASRAQSRVSHLMSELITNGADEINPFAGDNANLLENALQADFFKNIVVSRWQVQEELKIIYFFDNDLIPNDVREAVKQNEASNPYIDEWKKLPNYESILLLREFFANHFTKQNIESQADYMLTALCTELACTIPTISTNGKLEPTDGIMYASVAEGYKGINCVLTKEAVAAGKVKFLGAKCHMMTNPNEGFHSILAEAHITSEDTGDLTWKIFRS